MSRPLEFLEVEECIFSTEELTLAQHHFFNKVRMYTLPKEEAMASSFRYCGGSAHSRDEKYFKMIYPSVPYIPNTEKCVCGVRIKNHYYITNKEKTIIAILGSCCIERFWGTKSRTCEQCKAPHRNRTHNLCRECLKRYKAEQARLVEEERIRKIDQGNEVLEEYQDSYANERLLRGVVRFSKKKNSSLQDRRLNIMILLWPIFKKTIRETNQWLNIRREEKRLDAEQRLREEREAEQRQRVMEEKVRRERYEIERKQREAEYTRQWLLEKKRRAKRVKTTSS